MATETVSLADANYGIDVLLLSIAAEARRIMELITDLDDGEMRQGVLLTHMAGRIGWLADMGIARFGSYAPDGIDGSGWLLSAELAKVLGRRVSDEG